MSRPVAYESGAPNVYQPRPAEVPAHEEYTDPAAAHGWQNAYDATAELPRIERPGPELADRQPSGPRSAGRAARRRSARGRGGRRPRRMPWPPEPWGAAALIAGLSLSLPGSSSGPERDPENQAPSASAGSSGATDPAPSTRAAAPGATASGGPAVGVGVSGPTISPDTSGGPRVSGSPSAAASSGTSATPSASAAPATADGPGSSDGRGRGKGGAKKPKWPCEWVS
ncbi:hypothetical protein ACIRP7_17570 [Streptomyces sp. NPDC102270]|uniref:hypothetical protein n=1 Tax=Streptomyces sp. NPDC102270 TaxID=3366150 RepID=UPI003820EF66